MFGERVNKSISAISAKELSLPFPALFRGAGHGPERRRPIGISTADYTRHGGASTDFTENTDGSEFRVYAAGALG